MAYDLVIQDGMILDGSGFSRYRADIAITDGKIVEIGRIRGAAAQTIDADGLFVSPGVIDLHTHYDAQPFWDKLCIPSIWHDGPDGTPRRVHGAEGIHHVIVNGQVVLNHGQHTGALSGRVLRSTS